MARAAVDGGEVRFEVVFGSPPAAAELGHAFAALSVACRIAAREAAVLWSDARIARAYLAESNRREESDDGTDGDEDSGAPRE
jgi:hypothetical protein